MCLTCGKMLCSQSYCCQMELPEGSEPMVGACTFHANFCGAGVGCFPQSCFVTPPYLDEYGEADHGLKRGNPLRLDETSYSRLHNMWLSHSVPDVIAHTTEGTSNVMLTEWFHY
ncbi:E3 ubiquitin-protein ligase UBR2 [Armadillidium vulgare]|nr:E3 ubiquitin-protein ligase UBR2 [Armadillidium vulgare]